MISMYIKTNLTYNIFMRIEKNFEMMKNLDEKEILVKNFIKKEEKNENL